MENDNKEIKSKAEKETTKNDLVICVVAVVIFISVFFAFSLVFKYTQNESNSSSVISKYESNREETIEKLNEQTEASRLWISVASNIICKDDGITCYSKDGSSVLDNVDKNNKSLYYEIYKDNTLIYKSETIGPGESIYEFSLKEKLESGSYDIEVIAQGVDENNNPVGGTLNTKATLLVG